jgi:hypothetical protein
MYLGSKPELARKDSQTWSVSQTYSLYLYHSKEAYRTNKLQSWHLLNVSFGTAKSDVDFPLGSCNFHQSASAGVERSHEDHFRALGASLNFRSSVDFLSPVLAHDTDSFHATCSNSAVYYTSNMIIR